MTTTKVKNTLGQEVPKYKGVVPVFDPVTNQYEDTYPLYCRCGSPLTILEVKALGDTCSDCAMHYIEEEEERQNREE